MSIPKSALDTIAALRQERTPLAARLDAIDLAIDNLSRVYGLHGIPQPLPLERRRKVRRQHPKRPNDSPGAEQRREQLLAVIGRVDAGVTLGVLRKQTPQMDGKERSNALQQLRTAGKIRRVGNTWTIAA